ncbi:MAG: exodeoxyribonuclease VII large subunit [Firmicutes bacterium]|nr:exodeoxyribonuclease VII large subunit [Bacillota bacterium]
MSATATVLSVSDLTRYVKKTLDSDPLLQGVLVKGEISNFKKHTSGHLYFTLKDESSQVRCVMFRSSASRLAFLPENGMEVVVAGHVTVYERDGQYQLYAESIQPYGIGAYHIAFEQLKKKLEAEGLFDALRKRPLPLLPRRVGIITSLRGAALRDMVSICKRRFPGIKILVADVLVQGEEAPPRIISALSLMNSVEDVDVIIIGRGGGSVEELWAFNDERLARAIAGSRIPVVSAVGHETDFTIADFVADCRAPTPSAAAELVAPEVREINLRLADRIGGMARAVRKKCRSGRERLALLVERRAFTRPRDVVDHRRQALDDAVRDLESAIRARLNAASGVLERVAGRLDALSPLSVLKRGYGVVRRAADGVVVSSVRLVEPGDAVWITVSDGGFDAVVKGRDGGT